MMAVCLVHGGVEPQFFSQRLYNQVCGLPSPKADPSEIVDYTFKEKLLKILSAESTEQAWAAVMDASDELSMLGSVQCTRTLEDRDVLVQSATEFYLESRLRDAVNQFKEGLQCLGVLGEVTKHSGIFEEVFMYHPRPLTATSISELFKPILSEPGSNRRATEGRVTCFWRDWLLEVEEGGSYPLTLSDVLIFASGASTIPRLGFPVEPELHFLHLQEGEAQRSYPEANTCSIILKLPIHSTYEHFKDKMESGILQCPTFGTI
ncbi:G2/M phase-specific E3 ubiquitin-protein ligase-like [Astyanax mexicanus]|uniref:G2/M phase-specific E3 ubiquitin-protein ligase-like n=1 Tax=Astyanax mexicanus TaxID=7994 RepID=UPI0020CAAB59|nr:G2/M phase-specific E3 ubiquitin-protein ligase-like [Astyanax mexicanus]XP_049326305.1 G2/M phase-specific E3 ubiquitin-protein ligase-like [Astyanax mexicanus]